MALNLKLYCPMKVKLLLVEDEEILAELLIESLQANNYEVYWAKNGEEGFVFYNNYEPDVCIIDVMLPIYSGFALLEKIRNIDKEVAIIMLTSKSHKKDVIKGLELGANDYLTKPFSFRELELRLKNISKQAVIEQGPYMIGDYLFNFEELSLSYFEKKTQLTNMEANILKHLYINKGKVLGRKFIIKELWGNDDFFNFRSIDVHISKLRKHLSKDTTIKIISIRGEGYKLIVINEA